MTELNDKMERVSDMLATVSQLIACGKIKAYGNKVIPIDQPAVQNLVVETVYDDEASMVVIEEGMKGQIFPLHFHKDCIQFLICVRGKFSVNIPSDNVFKVLKPRECFRVDENEPHSVHCLEDYSKLVGIVIPPEPAYKVKHDSKSADNA